jgi:hypothetical protein
MSNPRVGPQAPSTRVREFLRDHPGEPLYYRYIAEQMGLNANSVLGALARATKDPYWRRFVQRIGSGNYLWREAPLPGPAHSRPEYLLAGSAEPAAPPRPEPVKLPTEQSISARPATVRAAGPSSRYAALDNPIGSHLSAEIIAKDADRLMVRIDGSMWVVSPLRFGENGRVQS